MTLSPENRTEQANEESKNASLPEENSAVNPEATIELVEASFVTTGEQDQGEPIVILTEDPDRKPIIVPITYNEEDVLYQYRVPNLKRLESGFFAPCKLDLTQEDASDVFIETFDFASSKKGLNFPPSVLTYIAHLFRENIAALINYKDKLTNPGFEIVDNFHGKSFINKNPISLLFMHELEEHLIYYSEASANFNFLEESGIPRFPNYEPTDLLYDLCSISEVITSTTLFEPFIGRASKTHHRNLVSEGQSAATFLSCEASKFESKEKFRDAYDFFASSYEDVYVGMQATRKYLRF